jgi:hypothetical protein
MLENEGTPSLTKSVVSVDTVERAQDFLSSYQTYTGRPVFRELKSTLNNMDANKNLTKTFGDKVLQVSAYDDVTHFKWYYTANGAVAPYSKFISLGFNDGFLGSFIDNWDLHSVGSTSVNLSQEDAVAIALDTARAHSWTMQLDEDNLDPANFNENRSVSWMSLVFDDSLNASKTRSEDVLELYPVWRVGLVLNKVYGELYGLEVDIWADTGEVRSVAEAYSPLVAQLFENNTESVGSSVAFVNGSELNIVVGMLFSTTAVSVIGVFAAGLLKRKNPKALSRMNPRFLKTSGVLIGFLLLLAIFLPLVATANATSRAGNVWGSRSWGATHPEPNIYSWRKSNGEISLQWYISDYIATTFQANSYTGFNHDRANKEDILYQADYFSNYYDYVAIVDFDHGVGGLPGLAQGYPNVPDDEWHYMFEDDYGTIWGTPDEYHADTDGHTDWNHAVYDIDMYNAFPPAKVHFAFIDACQSSNFGRLGQGFHPESGEPLGLPFAFTHRVVDYPATGAKMSSNGYSFPDSFPQCYIGFWYGSAALEQVIPYETGDKQWYEWVYWFFNLALNYDISVKDALDDASDQLWGCNDFLSSPLRGAGFTAFWPMDLDGDGDIDEEEELKGKGYHCTLDVYGNSNIHLKNFQPADYVTPPSVGGTTSGDVGVSYEFSARAIDSHGHRIKYVFDWDDGSPQEETGYVSNGGTSHKSHNWSSSGLYNVKVKAKCEGDVWSSWSTYTVRIGAIYWLYVDAYCEDFGGYADPYVWIDGDEVGQAPVCVSVEEGWHSVTVEWYWGYWDLLGFSDGYGNGDSRPIYSDTDITAYYGW